MRSLVTGTLCSLLSLLIVPFVAPLEAQSSTGRCPGEIADWPRVTSGQTFRAHYVSSYDRTGGNDDGFNGTYSALYTDEKGEHVVLDADGPERFFSDRYRTAPLLFR